MTSCMTFPDDPRADPFLTREPEADGARFAHLFRGATTFRQVDTIWKLLESAGERMSFDEVLEAALARSRELRAEGAAITTSSDAVWEEYGLLQNDVELRMFLRFALHPFYPRELIDAAYHHARMRRSELLAAQVVSGPAPF